MDELPEHKQLEFAIKGAEEGLWRAIGYRDIQAIRDAGALLAQRANEVADMFERLAADEAK